MACLENWGGVSFFAEAKYFREFLSITLLQLTNYYGD